MSNTDKTSIVRYLEFTPNRDLLVSIKYLNWRIEKEYDLKLLASNTINGIVDNGCNLVIVAIVGTNLHVRIFDASSKKVIDKTENELTNGAILASLKAQLNPIPDESKLSKEDRQKIIDNAIFIANYAPSKKLTVATNNSTGFPDSPETYINFNYKKHKIESNKFNTVGNNTYYHDIDIPECFHGITIDYIEFYYRWNAAALLTMHDYRMFNEAKLSPYRKNGYEYAAIEVKWDLTSFTQVVKLPKGYSPDFNNNDSIKIYTEKINSMNSSPVERNELKKYLTTFGKESFALTIPYPDNGYKYIIAWKLPEIDYASLEAKEFFTYAVNNGNFLAESFYKKFEALPIFKHLKIGIYVPIKNDRELTLSLVGQYYAYEQHVKLGDVALYQNERNYITQAWWGGVNAGIRQNSEHESIIAGFLSDELAVITVPIKYFLDTNANAEPWGVVRISIERIDERDSRYPCIKNNLKAWFDETLSPIILRAILSLINTCLN